MVIDLSELSVFLATSTQVQAHRKVNYAHWGRGLSLEDYLKGRAELVDIHEHAIDGRLATWVLAPRDDPQTLDFLSACETFRRHVLVQEPSSREAEETFGYGIGAVFCPPQHRKQGYTKHMMRLLHYVLAPLKSLPPFPLEWGLPPIPPPGAGNARFSALWSDIGPAYYTTCGPNLKSVGWKVKDPVETVWPTNLTAQRSTEVHWLSETDCVQLWQQDTQYFRERLANRSPGSSSIRCTFLPDCGLAAFQLRRCKFFLPGSPNVDVPEKWGVVMPGASQPTYATWITDIRPLPVALLITRIRASAETLPALLSAVMEAANENGASTVEVWNLEQTLLDTAHSLGGSTGQRSDHLPSLSWYGSGDVDDIQWLFNEKFCFC